MKVPTEISIKNLDEYKYKMIDSGMQSENTNMIVRKAIVSQRTRFVWMNILKFHLLSNL